MKLEKKAAVITGGSQGLGRRIAERYLEEGACVAVCARNEKELRQAERELSALAGATGRVIAVRADVAIEEEAANVVKACVDTFGSIDILVNNAGIHGAKGEIDQVDLTEWKSAIEVNLYGTIHMIRAAVPYMKKQGGGKIISLAGGGATGPRPYFSAYAASKAAIVRLTENFAKELAPYGIELNAVSPGAMNTRLLDDILSAGETIGAEYEKARQQKERGGEPTDTGAGLCVYLGSAESDGISGRLISAVWDNWQEFEEHKKELADSDIYTLRRIVSRDRGMDWEK